MRTGFLLTDAPRVSQTAEDLAASAALALAADGSASAAAQSASEAAASAGAAEDSAAEALDSASDAAASAASMSSIVSLFDSATTTNIFNAALLTGPASYNASGSYATSLNNYCASGSPTQNQACTPGVQHWVSCEFADSMWSFLSLRVNFYNSATPSTGSLVASSTAGQNGVAFSQSNRRVTFIPPAGATHYGINIARTGAHSPAEVAALASLMMANTGAALLPYDPPVTAGQKEFPASVANPSGRVSVYKSGTSLYVRSPLHSSSSRDVIRLLTFGVTPSTTTNGCVDFTGQRFVDRVYPPGYNLIAWNAGTVVSTGNDNGAPSRYNAQYLGGGHGLAAAFNLTSNGHGLTNAAVGDVGTISGVSWVLTRIVDANTLQVVRDYTGTQTNWFINGSISGSGSIIFANNGAKAFSASAGTQVWPIVKSLSQECLVEGVTPVSADGAYSGSFVTVRETYEIANPAAWLDTLKSERGTLTPKDLSHSSIPSQVRIDQTWRFDQYGGMTGYHTFTALQEIKLTTGSSYDFISCWQHQSIFASGHTLWQYMPGISGSVGGFAFSDRADITANAASVIVSKTDCADQANPTSHFCQYTYAGGAPVNGLAFGYMRQRGQGLPATRAQNARIWQMSSSEKQYPVAIDGQRFASQLVPAGTVLQTGWWSFAQPMASYPSYTIYAMYEDAGKAYLVLDVHETVTNRAVPIPRELMGRPLSVVDKSASFTLVSEMVTGDGLICSVSGGKGNAVIQIG